MEEFFKFCVILEKSFGLLATEKKKKKGQINLFGSDAKEKHSAALFYFAFLKVP